MPRRGTRKVRTKHRRGTKKRSDGGGYWGQPQSRWGSQWGKSNFNNAMKKIYIGKQRRIRNNFTQQANKQRNFNNAMNRINIGKQKRIANTKRG